MSEMLERLGPWTVAASTKLDQFPKLLAESIQTEVLSIGLQSQPRQGSAAVVVIEIARIAGGMAERALLGGEFRVGGSSLTASIPTTGGFRNGPGRDVPSLIRGRMVPGMPTEFAAGVLAGLEHGAAREGLVAGDISICVAAHHEVDTSAQVFSRAAEAFLTILQSLARGEKLGIAVLHEADWPKSTLNL